MARILDRWRTVPSVDTDVPKTESRTARQQRSIKRIEQLDTRELLDFIDVQVSVTGSHIRDWRSTQETVPLLEAGLAAELQNFAVAELVRRILPPGSELSAGG